MVLLGEKKQAEKSRQAGRELRLSIPGGKARTQPSSPSLYAFIHFCSLLHTHTKLMNSDTNTHTVSLHVQTSTHTHTHTLCLSLSNPLYISSLRGPAEARVPVASDPEASLGGERVQLFSSLCDISARLPCGALTEPRLCLRRYNGPEETPPLRRACSVPVL